MVQLRCFIYRHTNQKPLRPAWNIRPRRFLTRAPHGIHVGDDTIVKRGRQQHLSFLTFGCLCELELAKPRCVRLWSEVARWYAIILEAGLDSHMVVRVPSEVAISLSIIVDVGSKKTVWLSLFWRIPGLFVLMHIHMVESQQTAQALLVHMVKFTCL